MKCSTRSVVGRDGPHTPIRTCVGCRTRREQSSMLRFVRGPLGWTADPRRRAAGRGAYLCGAACAQKVARNKRFVGLSAAAEPVFLVP